MAQHSPGTGSVEPEKWLVTMATVDVAKSKGHQTCTR